MACGSRQLGSKPPGTLGAEASGLFHLLVRRLRACFPTPVPRGPWCVCTQGTVAHTHVSIMPGAWCASTCLERAPWLPDVRTPEHTLSRAQPCLIRIHTGECAPSSWLKQALVSVGLGCCDRMP